MAGSGWIADVDNSKEREIYVFMHHLAKFTIRIGCALIALGSSVVARGQPITGAEDHTGSTGVCFSHLSTVKAGSVVSFYQVVLVQSSGDLSQDIERINAASEAHFSHNPHIIPNVWLSAWLDDQLVDSTTGPDCSGLPMFKG